MENKIVISVKDISKVFKIVHNRQSGLKGTILSAILRKNSYEKFYVLKDVSFDIKKGDFIGVIGRNGSGKTTLLKIIAGILKPTKGSVNVNGKIAPFLELGLGFQEELTGKENILLYGAILGMTKKVIDGKYRNIVRFAELERFMDTELKNYSSGMQARLAFSIAINTDAEILLVDEVLSVGDINFQKKCYNYFKNLKAQKKTVIFVTHNIDLIKKYCDKVFYIEKGRLISKGDPGRIIKKYLENNR
mgnify:CR=1 FL=1|tara:strand:+ start:336 stop:1076 length:741 start_codon:yes stop_codon:yes gene_type:complete